jgi:hypothetical protein
MPTQKANLNVKRQRRREALVPRETRLQQTLPGWHDGGTRLLPGEL